MTRDCSSEVPWVPSLGVCTGLRKNWPQGGQRGGLQVVVAGV